MFFFHLARRTIYYAYALYKLKKGEKAKIILPSQLAFGDQGSSNGVIPPYTPLVYQIEIIDIK